MLKTIRLPERLIFGKLLVEDNKISGLSVSGSGGKPPY